MALPAVYRRKVGRDLAVAYGWYEVQRPGLGEEFLTAVEATFDAIEQVSAMFIDLSINRDSDFGSPSFPHPRSLSRREREEISLLPPGSGNTESGAEGSGRAQRGGRRREILS